MGLRDEPLLIFDGACGTNLQAMAIPATAWEGREGCNEWLNRTAPEAIRSLHAAMLEAGATVVETNTFGANAIVLAEYGLADRVAELNRAAVEHAHRAIAGRPGRYVAGSVGPTTKLPSLGHIGFDELHAAYAAQMRVLVEAGVDALVVETSQDLLQAKTAVIAAVETVAGCGRDVPILVSVTVEPAGTLLAGADLGAVAATLEPFPVFSLGLNCAAGPEQLAPHVRALARVWPRRLSLMPNAGLPEVAEGRTRYPLEPEAFAEALRRHVEEDGVSIVGGCCGTRPDHIRALAQALAGRTPAARGARAAPAAPALASAYHAVVLRQDPPPLLVGERANANGSKRFRERLLADDLEGALRVAQEQERDGAHAADLCVAYAGRDEAADLAELTRRFAAALRIPTVLDSTNPAALEAALRLHPGRCLINSVNLEDGGAKLDRVCALAKRFGAAVVALTIDERGMAATADEKLAVARRLRDRAVERHGLRPEDLLFDPLTFTLGAGDEKLRRSALETLEAIRRIKAELAGAGTILGVSNVSFGFAPRARRVLNSVFLHEALAAGLDAAIVDAGKVLPYAAIPEADRRVCLDLLYDRAPDDGRAPLAAFLEHFAGAAGPEAERGAAGDDGPPEERLAEQVVRGDADGLEDALAVLLRRRSALSILNDVLVPAMRRVGELFGRGELLLPFVLQSAEVMKRAVDRLRPHLEREGDGAAGRRVLLATVQGDVHDIGKNLVAILLGNNGYRVIDAGIKAPAAEIAARARAEAVDAIGLSGLLVQSALVMRDDLGAFRAAGLRVPVLLGGAALTPKFVARDCAPRYDGPVVYCADAFAGLRALRELEAGTLRSTEWSEVAEAGEGAPVRAEGISHDHPVPRPPFFGRRHVTDIDPRAVLPYLNEPALFRARWGYRRGKLSEEAYEALLRETVRPKYEELVRQALAEGLLAPRAAYGWFRAWADGDALVVEHDGAKYRFAFPRQAAPPRRCLSDFFRSAAEGGDVVGLFLVTAGERLGERARALFAADRYRDYFELHGFGVEFVEALAESWHERMRVELGIAEPRAAETADGPTRGGRGARYAFGYPACPDLSLHRELFALLGPEAIGVSHTDSWQLVPELSTSALVAHHPQATYFSMERGTRR